MTRLNRDIMDGDGVMFYGSPRRIVDSFVQTDDEDREERYVSLGNNLDYVCQSRVNLSIY